MCRSFILRSPVTFLLVALSMAPCAASVVYVDARATGANDGTSWADAYNCLQDALMFAAEGDEIHVAQGIYRPALSGGDRQATFQLVDGVMLRGGFTGLGAPDPDARDIQVWETILSGDLNGDDSENPESWVDNSYHVVIAKTARSVLLDGLEITGGNADGVEYSQQCGGGVFADGGLEMVQCRLVGNRAHYGGGLFCRPTSEDVPVLHIRDCRVEDNQAVMDGGGSYLYGSDVHFEDCVIEENRAVRHGGGVYEEDGHSRYLNCLLQGNEASFYIPGIPSHCGNGGAICSIGGRTHATDCRFAGNRASQGGAWFQREGTMQAQRDRFHLNWAWDCGGGMYLLSAEGEVEHCEFVRNCADDWGGGAIWNSQGTLRVLHCSMAGNRASDGGSGVYIYDHAHAVVINSIIRDSLAAGNYSYFAISYSNIVGAESYSGVGTIDADPGFRARPSGGCLGDEEGSLGDLRLSPGSPCINAGDTSAVSPGAVDLDGRPRVYGDIVDMGAYEYADLRTVYVDNRATGANDGTSWADAYNCLQDALMFAAEGDEIHVAQGVYRPDQFMLSDRPNLGRAESFHLRSGVAIRGGYAGLGAPNPDARDTERYETILTGDRLGNDVALAGTEWEQVDDFVRSDTLLDNCVTVITGVDVDASAVLDGVVITGGNANCYGGPRGRPESVGGGMYLVSASPTMVDCVFRANMSQALWWIDCGLPAPPPDPEEEWPYLVRPRAAGGAVYIAEGGPTFHRCRFVHNVVYSGDVSAGGGALCSVEADPVLVDCTFESNVATGFDDEYYGGAICALGGRLHLKGCTFTHNQAIYSSGGALYGTAVEVALEACTFMHNAARTSGGAIVLGEEGSAAAIRGCRFEGNQADRGGALYASAGTLDIARSAFRGNFAAYGGGAVDCWFGDLAFRNCLFAGNHTSSEGGAVHAFNSRLAAVGCTFADNAADQWGGALALSHFAVISADNSIFSDNSAEEGAHIWTSDETPVWLRYSDVTGGPAGISVSRPEDLHWGPGNIDAEPLFADPVGGDFHLKSQAGRWDAVQGAWVQDEVTSPCIDAGAPATPIMHEPFPNGGIVNMGAYGRTVEASKRWFGGPVCEVIVAGDINGDCRVDMGDLAIMAFHWLEVQ